uniref:Putative alpha crystallin n=1 Tax=Nyssomyia neivai TaxID=330878 RepID=A0A1L8DU74_9DIPT
MSVLPVILNFSDDFFGNDPFVGFTLAPREHWMTQRRRPHINCERRRRCMDRENSKTCVKKNPENGGFEMSLDVKQFKPEEISVKTVNNHIIVEAKHEEREDENSFVSRHFVRRYALPKDCNVQNVASSLSADGLLTVTAPPATKTLEERVIQIQQTPTATQAEEEKTMS